MAILVLGLIIFLGVHSVRIVANDWRTKQIARLGELTWKVIYSLLSIAGLALIVWGYGIVRTDPVLLFHPPLWTRHLALLLTLVAFISIAAAYVPNTRIKAKIGHPMVAGVKSWALGHILANGTLADMVLFGCILVWSIVNYAVSRRRDRANGTVYISGPWSRDVTAVVVGVVAWVVFVLYLHRWLIGVRPY